MKDFHGTKEPIRPRGQDFFRRFGTCRHRPNGDTRRLCGLDIHGHIPHIKDLGFGKVGPFHRFKQHIRGGLAIGHIFRSKDPGKKPVEVKVSH